MSTALVYRLRNNKDVLGFTLLAAIVSAILLGLYLALPKSLLHPLEAVTAQAVSGLLHGIGVDVLCHGNVVSSPAFSVRVIDECLGIEILLLSAACVLSFPAPWKKKLLALAVGFPILLMVNVVRMVMVFMICTYNGKWFDYAHIYFGQIMMLSVMVLLYQTWVDSLHKKKTAPREAAVDHQIDAYLKPLLFTLEFSAKTICRRVREDSFDHCAIHCRRSIFLS